jgi:dihydroorotate dehydrogenase electron transfer subunit
MLQFDATIASSQQLTQDCWKITFEAPFSAAEVKPGQFVMLKINETNDPLMRRPFSIFRCDSPGKGKTMLSIIYRVVGRGTWRMTGLLQGARISLLGPLGNGFRVNQDKKAHVLLAGGIGSAALYMQGQAIASLAKQNGWQLYTLLGAATVKDLLLEKEYKSIGGKLLISSDDGTVGRKGFVTDMLTAAIGDGSIPSDCAVYACGPEPMYKPLADICRERGIPAQVSMERHMMCGFGGCFVCVCKVNKEKVLQHRDIGDTHMQFNPADDTGYALACKDGPVFDIQEVMFDG